MNTTEQDAPFKEAERMISQQDKDHATQAHEEAEAQAMAEYNALPPVLCLGQEGKENVYWSRVYNNIYRLTSREHSMNDLRRMAKLSHYAKWLHPEYDQEQTVKYERTIFAEVAARLLEDTEGAQFNPERERGRGVWKGEQEGEFILNTGKECFCYSPSQPLGILIPHIYGQYLYTTHTKAMCSPAKTPLSYGEGRLLVDFLEARSWALKGSGKMLAGWCVCGLLSAALPIRPHMWINAPSNTGKSFLNADLKKILGNTSFKMDGGETTEAALRAELQKDALGVLWDEIEQDAGDFKKGQNIKRIIALIRNATSGGSIKKGSSGGGGLRSYKARCCFLLFSISHSLEGDADANRFFQLRLRSSTPDYIKQLLKRQEAGRELINQSDFRDRFMTRIMQELPLILSNIKSIEEPLKTQGWGNRQASLFAVLLSAAHAIEKGGAMIPNDIEEALTIAHEYSNTEEERESDCERLLNAILNTMITVSGENLNARAWLQETLEYNKVPSYHECYQPHKNDILKALDSCGIDWHLWEGAKYTRLFSSLFNPSTRLRGTPWENGKLSPVLMEGENTIGSVSPHGIIYTKLKKGGSSRTCFLIPPLLILDD